MRGNSINIRRNRGLEQCWNHILKPTQEYVCEINQMEKAEKKCASLYTDALVKKDRKDFKLSLLKQGTLSTLTIWL